MRGRCFQAFSFAQLWRTVFSIFCDILCVLPNLLRLPSPYSSIWSILSRFFFSYLSLFDLGCFNFASFTCLIVWVLFEFTSAFHEIAAFGLILIGLDNLGERGCLSFFIVRVQFIDLGVLGFVPWYLGWCLISLLVGCLNSIAIAWCSWIVSS